MKSEEAVGESGVQTEVRKIFIHCLFCVGRRDLAMLNS